MVLKVLLIKQLLNGVFEEHARMTFTATIKNMEHYNSLKLFLYIYLGFCLPIFMCAMLLLIEI